MLLHMKVALHRIGNSQGVILPKTVLAQVGFTENELEMTVERDAIVLRKPRKSVRVGWADAAKQLAQSGDDALVWPEFANEADDALKWWNVARFGSSILIQPSEARSERRVHASSFLPLKCMTTFGL
jgi:antitoxin MazE